MVVENNFAGVWERTIEAAHSDLTPDAARYFLALRFADSDRARINDLAAARAGSLSEAEEGELGNFMQLGWFLDFLKSKARLALEIRPQV